MAESPVSPSKDGWKHPQGAVDEDVLQDLRRKEALLSAACRCLDSEQSYRFFDTLASLAELAPDTKVKFLDALQGSGEYRAFELGAIRRLVMGEGATAFKEVVDMVRDIRIRQEIQMMVQ